MCPTLSLREGSRGLRAALCLSAAFWMLCNLCWSEPVPGDLGRLEPGSCEIGCACGEQAGILLLMLPLEMAWLCSLFWGNSCLAECLPLDGRGHADGMACRSQHKLLPDKCSQSHPCGEARAQSIRRGTGIWLTTEWRVLGRKVPVQMCVWVFMLRGATTCLCVPVHHCPPATASLRVQRRGCTAWQAALMLERRCAVV